MSPLKEAIERSEKAIEADQYPDIEDMSLIIADLRRRMEKKKKADPAVPPTPKPRNEVLDALAIVDGQKIEEVSPKAWSGYASALKNIRAVSPDVTPKEIYRRMKIYKAKHPEWEITASALAKWWGSCGELPAAASEMRMGDNLRR